jgi:hypothetical protein
MDDKKEKKVVAKKAPSIKGVSKTVAVREKSAEEVIGMVPDAPIHKLIVKKGIILFEEVNGIKTYRPSFVGEVDEAEERSGKKKYGENKPAETLTSAIRAKERMGSETQEELEARIARELDADNNYYDGIESYQACTKCGVMPVSEYFRIDRNLGFCEDCADLLRLGTSKEAKAFEFGLGSNRPAEGDDDDDMAV